MASMNTNTLVQVREYVGLTQAQLGERLGVPQSTICRWERRPGIIRLADLHRLAAALGVPASRLVDAGAACVPCRSAS